MGDVAQLKPLLSPSRRVVVVRLWVVQGQVCGVVEDVQTGARVQVDSLETLQREMWQVWSTAVYPPGGLR